MRFFGSTIGKLVLALLTAVCPAAKAAYPAEAATVSSAPKPVTHSSTHTISSPARRPPVKKTGSSPSTVRSASHATTSSGKSVTQHTGSPHYAARRTPPRTSSTYAAKRAPSHTGANASQHKAAPGHNRYASPAPVRTLSGQQRLARLRLQPERVQEIQQALIREGYLQGEPSGLWDTTTRGAMLRYQTMHGFPPTGLPEAKSLMKLGLGSHPLPPELDHGPVAAPAPAAAQGGLTSPLASPPVSEARPPS